MKIKEFMMRCNMLGLYTLELTFSVSVAYVEYLDDEKIAYSYVDVDRDEILNAEGDISAKIYNQCKSNLIYRNDYR